MANPVRRIRSLKLLEPGYCSFRNAGSPGDVIEMLAAYLFTIGAPRNNTRYRGFVVNGTENVGIPYGLL
jgi:hypothetical protein